MITLVIVGSVLALVVVGGLWYFAWSAPEGWEDDGGFHYGKGGER